MDTINKNKLFNSDIKADKNNSELNKFINFLTEQLFLAKRKEDISSIIDKCIDFPYKIEYDLTKHYISLALLLFLSLVFFTSKHKYNNSDYFLSIILIIGNLTIICLIFSAFSKIKKLNEKFISKTMSILYKSTPISEKKLNKIHKDFLDFYRGNYENTLTSGVEIDFHSPKGIMRVSVVNYHYVDRYERVVNDSKGNWHTEYTYRHYYRQGIIFPVGKPASLIISRYRHNKHYPETFLPASNTFKKRFRVQGRSEFDIAKLLEPDVVLKIEEISNSLKDLTIEFSDEGDMLICQNNTNLLKLNTKFNLSNPQAFKDELFSSSYGKLDQILTFASGLIKQIR